MSVSTVKPRWQLSTPQSVPPHCRRTRLYLLPVVSATPRSFPLLCATSCIAHPHAIHLVAGGPRLFEPLVLRSHCSPPVRAYYPSLSGFVRVSPRRTHLWLTLAHHRRPAANFSALRTPARVCTTRTLLWLTLNSRLHTTDDPRPTTGSTLYAPRPRMHDAHTFVAHICTSQTTRGQPDPTNHDMQHSNPGARESTRNNDDARKSDPCAHLPTILLKKEW